VFVSFACAVALLIGGCNKSTPSAFRLTPSASPAKTSSDQPNAPSIQELPEEGNLNLGDTEITNEGLDHLSDLSNLEVLNLGGTQVTDAGFEKLHGLTNLKRLSFSRGSVTDKGLTKIK
jgi:Leucine-rich repeat (LRR) protein